MIYYNDLETPTELLNLIRKFEQQELTKTQKQWDAFAAKYGTTGPQVEKSTGDGQAVYPFKGIRDGIENVAKTREVMATDLVENAQDRIANLPNLHDLYRMNGHDTARGYLKLAQAFSPNNPDVVALADTIEKSLNADLKDYVAQIDDKEWPGSSSGKVAKEGMSFFEKDIGWGGRANNPHVEDKEPRRPIGIVITGDWSVQKKDIDGRATMYGIPALVAVQLDREKPLGLARVYSVTLRTAESANPVMEPPFNSVSVGDSYFIKAEQVE